MSREPSDNVDARFTLANERTFLAWIRTSLGLLAGGVAVHTLVQPFNLLGVRRAIALSCILLAVTSAFGAYRRWSLVAHALANGEPLPETKLVPMLAAGVGVLAIFACVAVLKG